MKAIYPNGDYVDSAVRGASGLNIILGVWLIVCSFIWAYGPATPVPSAATGGAAPAAPAVALAVQAAINAHWNDIVVGALVLILGAWSAMSGRTTPATTVH